MTRADGILSTWNDERGFGFITPSAGGTLVFVHISAFGRDAVRPQAGDVLSFASTMAPDGKVRASRVRGAGGTITRHGPAAFAGYLSIAAFIALGWCLSTLWSMPSWLVVLYTGMSVLCFAVYALDKSAARAGRRRVPESTLLLLGLAGGWPGGALAQQWLRHKNRKQSFLTPFWVTVIVNVGAFALLMSPLFRDLVGRLAG